MITIWHNPRCSKSRETLSLLQDTGADITVRKYLADNPTIAELELARIALGNPPVLEMMRTGEKVFREQGLSTGTADDVLLRAMAENPILIERPLVFRAGRAVIARPPEKAKTLL